MNNSVYNKYKKFQSMQNSLCNFEYGIENIRKWLNMNCHFMLISEKTCLGQTEWHRYR